MSTIQIAQISGCGFVQFFLTFCLTNLRRCGIMEKSPREECARRDQKKRLSNDSLNNFIIIIYSDIRPDLTSKFMPLFYLFFNHCERNFSPTIVTVADLFFKTLKLKFINKIRTNLAANPISINLPKMTVFSLEIFLCITH